MTGGHVGAGCVERITMEAQLAYLDGWTVTRLHDPATGCRALEVSRRAP